MTFKVVLYADIEDKIASQNEKIASETDKIASQTDKIASQTDKIASLSYKINIMQVSFSKISMSKIQSAEAFECNGINLTNQTSKINGIDVLYFWDPDLGTPIKRRCPKKP